MRIYTDNSNSKGNTNSHLVQVIDISVYLIINIRFEMKKICFVTAAVMHLRHPFLLAIL